MFYKKTILFVPLCILYGLFGLSSAFAQVITTVPSTKGNSRFFTETYSSVKRPGLSVVGFDNGGDNSKGLGLKQILNEVYTTGTNEEKTLFLNILVISKENIVSNPTTQSQIQTNSNILQYLAFEALCSYVLENNGITPAISNSTYGIPIRDYHTVLLAFKNDINTILSHCSESYFDESGKFYEGSTVLVEDSGDYVKDVDSYQNIARAIDLYLALENAFDKWNGNTDELLDYNQKFKLIHHFNEWIYILRTKRVDKDYYGIALESKFEPGNRPLKGYVDAGYASMASQKVAAGIADFSQLINDYVSNGIYSASSSSNNDHDKKWMYQTDNGNRFWAEGAYYFNFALLDVVQFWHAVRANNMLGNTTDPFHSSWFLNPVEWLADVSTPDGLTPPLDDGNKHIISSAPLLRWSSVYGDATVGKKFNAIYQTTNNYFSGSGHNKLYLFDDDTYLMQLAIPKTTSTTPITYNVGGSSEQQHIARYTDASGKHYYVLMNGEKGDAISRGEGHEQPDQLQLLYYIDGTSYVMDTGYDKPQGTGLSWKPSSWNNWDDHNVMVSKYLYTDPLLYSPQKGWTEAFGYKKRVISDYRDYDVEDFSQNTVAPKIIELKGRVTSTAYNDIGQLEGYLPYSRETLFIEDPDHPYLVDMNSMQGPSPSLSKYNIRMKYFSQGNLNTVGDWQHFALSQTGADKDLYIYLRPVEFTSPINIDSDTLTVEEYYKKPVLSHYIQLYDKDWQSYNLRFTTVAFIDASSNTPSYEPTSLIASSNSQPASVQVWSWRRNSTTVDVLVRRSGNDSGSYPNSFAFNALDNNGNYLTHLVMASGKDYGFARLILQNGYWNIDSNYQINLSKTGYSYPSNDNIGTYTYPTNSDIYIGNNVTLTITGTVTLQPGTTVHLGVGAVIHTTGSGNIQATGTMFKTLTGSNDASQRYKYVRLDGSGSQFTQCTFQGGSDGVVMASSGNQFDRCTFEYNLVGFKGMYSGEGSIIGSVFIHNHYGINLSQTAVVYTGAYQNGSTFTPTSISSNSSYGLYIYDNAMAVLHYTRVDNNSYGARTSNYGRLYAGDVDWSGSDQGWNRFTSNTNYAIYNTSLAADGSTWTDEARDNWWGTTSPPSGYFYGSVDYGNPLTYDPTVNEATSKAAPSNMEVMGNNGGTNEILTTSQNNSSSPSNAKQHASERLADIYAQLSKQPDAPGNYQLLQKAYGLIQLYDQADSSGLLSKLDSYGDQFHTTMVLSSNSLNTGMKLQSSKPSKSIAPSKAMKRMGATAVLLKIDHLLRQGEWKEVQTLADRFDPYIRQKDDRSALLASRVVAWENQKQFGKALAALKQIESIKPDPDMAGHYVAPDYSLEEAALKDSMKAHSQIEEVVASSKSDGQHKETLNQSQKLPREFSLGDNYPNPFNPTTMIPINLPKESHVEVVVYNIAGQRVATLANREYQAGSYQLRFDAHQLASGVYFIRARLGEKTFIRRVTLIK